jgi:hypothetical protein
LLAKAQELLRHARSVVAAGRPDSIDLSKIFDRYRDAICGGNADVTSADATDELPLAGALSVEPHRRPSHAPPRYVFHLSMTARLLGRHRATVLAADDTWRRTLERSDLQASRAELAIREQALIDEFALSSLRNAWRGASALLEREGVDFSHAPLPAMLSFVERYLREELDLVRMRIARLNGADIPSPKPPSGALDEDEWAVMQATWAAARLPRPATRYEAALAVKRLRECTGSEVSTIQARRCYQRRRAFVGRSKADSRDSIAVMEDFVWRQAKRTE